MSKARFATLTCYLAFVGLGISGTLLGPTFQSLTRKFEMPLENAGIFTALQFGGVSVGVLLFGWILDRINARWMLSGGALLMGSGLLLIGAAETLEAALIGAGMLGLGYGALDVAPNMVIVALNPKRASAALNLLNVFYGIGAVIGPQLVSWALRQENFTLAFSGTALFVLALAVPFAFVSVRVSDEQGAGVRANIRWLALLPFFMMLFLQVGAEVGYSSWIFAQLNLAAAAPEDIAALATSLFWVGLTAGRLNASWLLRRISNGQMIVLTVTIMIAGVLLILVLPSAQAAGLLSAVIVGFGVGPLFPTVLAFATDRYPSARGTASGVLIAVGTLGGTLLPLLQGQVGGGRDGGMVVVLAAAALLLMVGLWLLRADRRESIPVNVQ
ncbi:MAG: MFS transporter [Chloroflexi bacterium CFX4]|nr:MFS transporter [Chloroflexi bacterium CFX4]MDL1923799.1 MFS transporter [Chloroflexi bacterium CFX3]